MEIGGFGMKKYFFMFSLFLISSLLVCCDDKLKEIKDAASGIDNQAEKAAKAISPDAHTIRSIEINYENYNFTINELFKTILRDTLWEYEQKGSNHVLMIKGVWKNPLFESYQMNIDKDQLSEKGTVKIELQFEGDKLIEENTHVVLEFENDVILDEKGKEILYELYKAYIKSLNNS